MKPVQSFPVEHVLYFSPFRNFPSAKKHQFKIFEFWSNFEQKKHASRFVIKGWAIKY